MDLTMIKSLYRQTADFVDREITLGGWIRTMRVSKNFGFIEFLLNPTYRPLIQR